MGMKILLCSEWHNKEMSNFKIEASSNFLDENFEKILELY